MEVILIEKIIIIGYGGHADSIADSIEQKGEFEIGGYLDKKYIKKNQVYPYMGDDDELQHVFDNGIRNAVIGVGYMGNSILRDELFRKATKIGYHLPVIIDKTAALASNVQIGDGSFIGKNAVINAGSRIGKMCIINSGAIIEHENRVDDYSHISVGTVLCGNVYVENHVFVGANATVIQGTHIGMESIIGAGSIVLKDVMQNSRVYGVWK